MQKYIPVIIVLVSFLFCDDHSINFDGQNDFEMLGLEINPNKRGILFVEWPEKIEKFGIGNEIYIKLEDKIECRLAKISSDNQDFLGSIDGIELNNPV